MNTPSFGGREVVLNRAFVASLVAVLVALAAVFGLPIDPATQENLVNVLVVVLPVLATFGAGLWSRKAVTPVSDPRAKDGTPLVPVPVLNDATAAAVEAVEAAPSTSPEPVYTEPEDAGDDGTTALPA